MMRATMRCSMAAVLAAATLAVAAPAQAVTWPVEDLGPAAQGVAFDGSVVVGDTIWAGQRREGGSAAVVAYDLATKKLLATVSIPDSTGVQALSAAPDGSAVYAGTYNNAAYSGDLYRIDTRTYKVTTIAAPLPGAQFVWNLATAPDGMVYAGTWARGELFEYDPAAGTGPHSLGQVAAGAAYVRSVAVTADTVYAGTGTNPRLVAIDRATHAKRDITPAQFAGEGYVYDVQVTPDYVIAGTYPHGYLAIIDRQDPSQYRFLRVGTEQLVVSMAVLGHSVYLNTMPSGKLWRYDLDTGTLTTVATPVPGDSAYDINVHDDTIIGATSTGAIWTYDPTTDKVTVEDLQAAGVVPVPEEPFGLEVGGGHVYVGGHFGLDVHDIATGQRTHVHVPGEPKVIAMAHGQAYLALYPGALLWRYDPEDGQPHAVTTIGAEQNRPQDIEYDPGDQLLLTATMPAYGQYSGALGTYDLLTGGVNAFRGIADRQSAGSVASWPAEHLALVGTDVNPDIGLPPAPGPAVLIGWDLTSNREAWRITPVAGATSITDLQRVGSKLFGLTREGWLFVVDLKTHQVLHTQRLGTFAGFQSLAKLDGKVYAALVQGLYEVDPTTYAASYIYPAFFGQIAADQHGEAIYGLSGTRLYRLTRPQ